MPMVIISWYSEIIAPRICCSATSARYSGAVKVARPIARPRITRAAISVSGDHAAPLSSEPSTNSTPPRISERLRPRVAAIQPAPTAAPSIIELTIHSIMWSEIRNSRWMNWVAPEITPMSRPNINPASAASTQVKMTVAFGRTTVLAAMAFMDTPRGKRLACAVCVGARSRAMRLRRFRAKASPASGLLRRRQGRLRYAGETRFGQAAHADGGSEQRAGQRLPAQHLGGQAVARAGDVESVQRGATQCRARGLPGRQVDDGVLAAVGAIAHHA